MRTSTIVSRCDCGAALDAGGRCVECGRTYQVGLEIRLPDPFAEVPPRSSALQDRLRAIRRRMENSLPPTS